MCVRTEDFYKDIAKDVDTKFNTSGYSKNDSKPLPTGKKKKVIGMMKDELDVKIMTEFVASMAKIYVNRKLDKTLEDKCCKNTKESVVAKNLTY